jgi:hypothetical protein
MGDPNYRIPDDMAAEVLAEATRLHAEANRGYSFEDLQQACAEAQIPSHIVTKAIRNIQDKRSRKQAKQQELKAYIIQQSKKGISIGVGLLIPIVAISGMSFLGFNPYQQKPKSEFPTLTVKEGKLEYLKEPKGLSIAVRESKASSYSDGVLRYGAEGIISTDGYENLPIKGGKVGDVYNYKGIYNYRIKIIETDYNTVKFQVEQQGEETYAATKRFEDRINNLQQEQTKHQTQIKAIEKERDSIKEDMKIEKSYNKSKEKDYEEKIETKDKEIQSLNDKLRNSKVSP